MESLNKLQKAMKSLLSVVYNLIGKVDTENRTVYLM